MQIKCISSRANTKYWFKWNALYDDHLKESPSRRKRKEFEKRKASRRKCTKSGQTNFFFFYFCSVVFSLLFSTVFFFVFLLWWAVASLFAQEQQMRWSSAWQWNFWRTCTKRCTPCCVSNIEYLAPDKAHRWPMYIHTYITNAPPPTAYLVILASYIDLDYSLWLYRFLTPLIVTFLLPLVFVALIYISFLVLFIYKLHR